MSNGLLFNLGVLREEPVELEASESHIKQVLLLRARVLLAHYLDEALVALLEVAVGVYPTDFASSRLKQAAHIMVAP